MEFRKKVAQKFGQKFGQKFWWFLSIFDDFCQFLMISSDFFENGLRGVGA